MARSATDTDALPSQPLYAISEIEDLISRANEIRSKLPKPEWEARPDARELIHNCSVRLKGAEYLQRHLDGYHSLANSIPYHEEQIKLWTRLRGKLEVRLTELTEQSYATVEGSLARRQAEGIRDILDNLEGGFPEIVVTAAGECAKEVFGTIQPSGSLYAHVTALETIQHKIKEKVGALDNGAKALEEAIEEIEQQVATVFKAEAA